jgi:hypothetical protein
MPHLPPSDKVESSARVTFDGLLIIVTGRLRDSFAAIFRAARLPGQGNARPGICRRQEVGVLLYRDEGADRA